MIIKTLTTALPVFFSFVLTAQDSVLVFPKNLDNVKTDQHIRLKNTRLFVIPPAGFAYNDTTRELKGSGTDRIGINDIHGFDFRTVIGDYTKERYKRQYPHLFDFKAFTINGHKARSMYWRDQDDKVKVIEIMLGDSTFTTHIVAIYDSKNEAIENEIIAALRSVVYDKDAVLPPFSRTSFRLDDKQSIFKLATYTGMALTYSVSGVVKTSYADQPHVIVLPTSAGEGNLSALSQAMERALEVSFPGVPDKWENTSTANVNGFISAYGEIKTNVKGRDAIIVMHAVLVGNQMALMQGLCFTRAQVAELKKLTYTVKANTQR